MNDGFKSWCRVLQQQRRRQPEGLQGEAGLGVERASPRGDRLYPALRAQQPSVTDR